MNLLQVALTTKCNFSCSHCPMAQWRNTTPKYPLNNTELIPFIEQYCKPKDWIIELTGGEPALYDGLDKLLQWLSLNQYRVLIKTNGSLPINKYRKITRCAAFHNYEAPPKYYDLYLIINGLDSDRKIQYCREHRIPYRLIGLDKTPLPDQYHSFVYMAFINAAGHQIGCPAATATENEVDGVDLNRITHRPLIPVRCCTNCKIAFDSWRFL